MQNLQLSLILENFIYNIYIYVYIVSDGFSIEYLIISFAYLSRATLKTDKGENSVSIDKLHYHRFYITFLVISTCRNLETNKKKRISDRMNQLYRSVLP